MNPKSGHSQRTPSPVPHPVQQTQSLAASQSASAKPAHVAAVPRVAPSQGRGAGSCGLVNVQSRSNQNADQQMAGLCESAFHAGPLVWVGSVGLQTPVKSSLVAL